MLMTISLITSLFMILLKHPLSMGMMLMLQTIMISLTMGFFNFNYWYSYILFLIMISGMLVLFIYMTSIASNELFYPSIKLFTMFIIIITLMLIIYMNINKFYFMINNLYELYTNIHMNNNFQLSLNKYMNFPNNFIMYMMIIYLLITLVAVVKITDFKKGALRMSPPPTQPYSQQIK
uniref:NADH-ubiquinone oxidoreductase chain 6 n=1 Tax=Scarabaeidae sp. BMNH 1274753 TaxID=1796541 RepID=A0A126TGP0_9SCAR|nr:NADH dehydrogenase subunit 6 [Scarabaeidae sp. BMNH 1274753]